MRHLSDTASLNLIYPITAIDIYKSGIQVHRKSALQSSTMFNGARKPIAELTRRSLSRLAFVVSNTEVEFHSMLTLTYPDDYPLSGKVSKKHLRRFLNDFQHIFGKQSYLWFLEFQERGAPHYHILVEMLGPNKWMRRQFGYSWARIVCREQEEVNKCYAVHSHTRQWEQIRKRDGARRYALQYAAKPTQKIVPQNFRDVGRFWGCSRDVIPKPKIPNVAMDSDELSQWLNQRGHHTANWDFVPKFVWHIDT